MRIWLTDKKVWHGRMPKRHWPSSIHPPFQRLPGPILRGIAVRFDATFRKCSRTSMRCIATVTAFVSRVLPSGRVAEP
jgi:hypothetical protein